MTHRAAGSASGRSALTRAGLLASLVAVGCGGGPDEAAAEPDASPPVAVHDTAFRVRLGVHPRTATLDVAEGQYVELSPRVGPARLEVTQPDGSPVDLVPRPTLPGPDEECGLPSALTFVADSDRRVVVAASESLGVPDAQVDLRAVSGSEGRRDFLLDSLTHAAELALSAADTSAAIRDLRTAHQLVDGAVAEDGPAFHVPVRLAGLLVRVGELDAGRTLTHAMESRLAFEEADWERTLGSAWPAPCTVPEWGALQRALALAEVDRARSEADFEEVRSHLTTALFITRLLHGPASLDYAEILADAAEVEVRRGRPAFAVPLLERALSIVGVEHPSGHPLSTRIGARLREVRRR